MSAQNLARFVAQLALDYEDLAVYMNDPESYLPRGGTVEQTHHLLEDAFGELTEDEKQVILDGDFNEIFQVIRWSSETSTDSGSPP